MLDPLVTRLNPVGHIMVVVIAVDEITDENEVYAQGPYPSGAGLVPTSMLGFAD